MPDKTEEGYSSYQFNEMIYMVIPEKYITIEPEQTYRTEIIIGCPEPSILTKPIELWIGFRSTRPQQNLQLISRILIDKKEEK